MLQDIRIDEFWNGLFKKARSHKIPIHTSFALTYKCNLSCSHCYKGMEADKSELDFDGVTNILDELKNLGTLTILFTGGEIFTREDFPEILKYADKSGYFIELFTNGTLIDESIKNILIDIRLIRVNISLYGIPEGVYKKVTSSDSFNNCIKGINFIKGIGIPLKINMLVTKDNLDYIHLIKRYAKEINADFELDGYINPALDGDRSPINKRINPKEYISINDISSQNCPKDTAAESNYMDSQLQPTNEVFTCNMGKSSMAIDPYGRVNFCTTLPFPKLDSKKTGIRGAWQKLVEFRERLDPYIYKCNYCDLKEYCDSCPGNAYLEKRSIYECVEYLKEAALLAKYADK